MARSPESLSGMDAVSAFENSLGRYKAAYGDGHAGVEAGRAENDAEQAARRLKDAVTISEEEFRERVVRSYRAVLSPRDSSTEHDQSLLLEAHRLYCGVQELYSSCSPGNETYVEPVCIKSPLTFNERYKSGSGWIYMQAWFRFSANVTDLVPVIKGGTLYFVSSSDFEPDALCRRIHAVIEEEFYTS